VTQVCAYFKEKVFTTIVPRNVRLSEAPSYGKPISRYDPQSSGGKAYNSLAEEVMRRGA
jgi:chromosome partitioning protein